MDGIDKTIASVGDGLDGSDGFIGESVLSSGSVFAERYKIVSEGKAGGMGVVYKCLDLKLDQEATALKIIHPRLLHSEEALRRFHQEVTISRKLSHDGIVRVHDIGSYGGLEYFTMEWLDGVSLRDVIADRKKQHQPFSLEETYEIIHSLAEALQHAHRYTIHRDIKPENIMLSEGGQFHLKLMDFGIAKMMSISQLATTSMQMGTPYYMAPEQKLDTGHVDKRADIYSVGVILFELLTLENTIGPELPSDLNPKLPKEIDDVFRKAVALRPENRYGDVGELAAALSKIVSVEKGRLQKIEKEEQLKREAELAEQKKREAAEAEQQKREEERKEKEQREQKEREEQEKKRLAAEAQAQQEQKEREAEKKRLEDERKAAEMIRMKREQESNEPDNGNRDETISSTDKKSKQIKKVVILLTVGVFLIIGYIVMQITNNKDDKPPAVGEETVKQYDIRKTTETPPSSSQNRKETEVDLKEAIDAYNNSQYDVAIKLCRSVLRRDPNNLPAKQYLHKSIRDQENAVNNAFDGKVDVNKFR